MISNGWWSTPRCSRGLPRRRPGAIAHPTDARLCHRALEKLVDLAQRHGVPLRQSYRRVAKRAAIMIGRYSHAHQFKRARRELKFLRIRLGCQRRWKTRPQAGARVGQFRAAFSDGRAWVSALARALPL